MSEGYTRLIIIFAFLIAAIWVAWIARGSHHILLLIPAAHFAVVLAAPPLWQAALAGYQGDSFWTLHPSGRAGVVAIALVGVVSTFTIIAIKSRALRRFGWPTTVALSVDVLAGLLIFGFVYSVGPQVFYTFYRIIIPDLPAQWVIDTAFDTTRVLKVARVNADGSMSDHLAGVTLWAILPFTFWQHFQTDGARG